MWLLPENTPEYQKMLDDADKKYGDKKFMPKPAVTNYRVLDEGSEAALVLCQPESGTCDVTGGGGRGSLRPSRR